MRGPDWCNGKIQCADQKIFPRVAQDGHHKTSDEKTPGRWAAAPCRLCSFSRNELMDFYAGYGTNSYSFHVMISGGGFYGLLLLNYLLFPYFLTVLLQLILYLRKKSLNMPPNRIFLLVCWPFTAIFSGLVTSCSVNRPGISIPLAAAIYLTVVLISNKIRTKDWKILQSLYQ